ncbi:MAG: T9SS type A sorting domain-containing protein [Melioribacteraceae bacterium]|nr:T9SS type A sorting domain-containing protein [Melioribacteraceae bacterium]
MIKFSKTTNWWQRIFLILFAGLLTISAQSGINEFGSFEQDLPSYWTKSSEPAGATLTWASDEFVSMGRSLKLSKEATSEAAMWESENMVDLWSERHFKDVDIKMGVSYKTEGVNTNPATEDEKWYVSYTFYREDGSEIGSKKFELDQSVASTSGWVEDSTAIGEVILPEDSYTTIIRFVGGKDAVGTVWADNFVFVGRGGWAGQDWNTQVGVPTGWFYWLPPIGGNDGELTAGYERTVITDEEAMFGNYSLKFNMLEGTRDGFVGTRKFQLNEVVTGDKIRISVWIKGEDLHPDSVAAVGDQWSVAITPIFHNTLGNNEGWGEFWASDIPLVFPKTTSFDWTQFYVDVPVQDGAVSLSVRLHPLGRFQGTVYMDGLTVEKLDVPQISEIGSFEQDLPSYWTKGSEPAGATLTWASDEFVSMGRSLKLSKEATSEAAMWESENMVDLWSERHFKDVDIKMGVSYKTEGVNTNPATEDEKWYVSYTFYREDGSEIGSKKFELDQSVASTSGWIEDSTAIGEVILPEDSYTTIIRFVGGKNAVGTVWADNFVFVGRGGWAGQDWNTQVGVPTGWFYWLPPIGGNDGELTAGYERTVITDEEAMFGNYSLKFDMLEGTRDGFVGTRKFALNTGSGSSISSGATDIAALENINPGDMLRISVWIKGEDLHPDSVAAVGDQWSVAITPIFHNTLGNNEGWGEFWASDIPLVFPKTTSFDWTQFYVDVPVQDGAVSLSVRLHPLGRFQGTVYMDGLTVEKLDVPQISEIGSFEQDLPSYWTKGSEPAGATLTWASDEFVSMGRSLKLSKEATSEAAMWESENMVDLWSERHFKDVDIKMGVSYKTEGVNTNPATEDEKWYVSYTFYREDGSEIGSKKFELDQSVASTSGWIEDSTAIGEVILPEDSYTTIIRFVGGKNAVGTVWADNFVFVGRGGWAGQDWNTQVGVPTGWFYWLPPIGGNDGELTAGYERTVITDEEAKFGNYSLKFDLLEGTRDGFVGTRKYALDNGSSSLTNNSGDITVLNDVKAGDVLRISVWIMGEDLHPDSVAAVGDQWSVAITPIFHNTIGNNAGWGEFWASDIPLVFPKAQSFGWTQFYVDVPVQEGAVALSVRLHPLGRFQGTVFMDGLTIQKINDVTDVKEEFLPTDYSLFQNYPNPFNPSTVISYALPQQSNVTVRVYDMLGREVKTLVNDVKNAGMHEITWNADNNYGSKVASGTYIYVIKAGEFYQAKKMIMLK